MATITYLSNFGFTTGQQLLSQLETTLGSAQWILLSSSSAQLVMVGKSFGDNCFLQASIVSRPNGQEALELRGSLNESLSLLSPLPSANLVNTSANKSLLDLRYQPNGQNKLWITAASDAFVIAVRNANSTNVSAWWFGFLDRPKPELDPFGWGLGPVHWGYGDTHMAKSWATQTNWFYLGSAFGTDMQTEAYNASNAYGLNFANSTTQSIKPFVNPYSQAAVWNRGSSQVANNPFIGTSLNGTGIIKPWPYWLQEVQALPALSFNGQPHTTVFRGFVKFVANGFGHLSNGATITDVNGVLYLAIARGCTGAIVIG